jgi:hypothetical protein
LCSRLSRRSVRSSQLAPRHSRSSFLPSYVNEVRERLSRQYMRSWFFADIENDCSHYVPLYKCMRAHDLSKGFLGWFIPPLFHRYGKAARTNAYFNQTKKARRSSKYYSVTTRPRTLWSHYSLVLSLCPAFIFNLWSVSVPGRT